MPGVFIGEPISMEWVQEVGFKRPVSFTWDGKLYVVKDILMKWDDYGFGASPPKRRTWWMRRHRTYYHVLTETGQVFEIYLDRASHKSVWVLVKEVVGRA